MITLDVNLGNLKSVVRELKGKNGAVDCLIIPIKENNLFKGKKGVYLKIIAFELKNKKDDRKDTHLLKQSYKKEEIEAMSEDQKAAIPLLGSLTVWDDSTQTNASSEISDVEMDNLPEDDLPF
jgi:hypothetical protein